MKINITNRPRKLFSIHHLTAELTKKHNNECFFFIQALKQTEMLTGERDDQTAVR